MLNRWRELFAAAIEKPLHHVQILYMQPQGIGDVLMSTPILRALKQKFPDCSIDYVTMKQCMPVLEENPNIRTMYDWGAQETIDFAKYTQVLRPYIRTQLFKPDWPRLGMHLMDLYALHAGVTLTDRKMELRPIPVVLKNYGLRVKKYVCIRAKSSAFIKDWEYTRFGQLTKLLMKEYPVVVTGKKGDPTFEGAVDMTGMNLRESAYVIQQARLLISVDSIGMHIAGAVETPALGLYGATDPKETRPLGYEKFAAIVPKDRNGCGEACHLGECIKPSKCIDNITVDEVYEKAKVLLRAFA